ncbi:vanomycin resistance protein VanB [Nocardioides phosphati]|uniref:Vanomycin resistance protein VanB n=1 Tax=Nocardioides phosphati TaxID=1867775 RepID=A0ABQ2N9E2_9ACTN|nr:VanW family protein [Nocardioides phosphati]GGO89438.1 vanomycin resistance protein VanB [Nocardioides phosphati]
MGRRLGGGAALIVRLAVVLLLAGLYVAAWAFAADRLPRGATVAGVEVGGLSPAAAKARLEKEFANHDTIAVSVGGARESLTAGQLGLHFDAAATVAEAGGGRSFDPRRLWDYYAGVDEVAPVVNIDGATLEQAVSGLEQRHGRPAREGAVRFTGGVAKAVPARTGLGLDRETTRAALEAAYVAGAPATLALTDVQPQVTDAETAAALESFARPAMSAPVTLRFDDQRVVLKPQDFAPALSMVAQDGELVPHLSAKRLRTIVDAHLGDAGKAVDATVKLVGGVPRVVPGRPGVTYDPRDVSGRFLDLVVRPGSDRTLDVRAKVAKPKVTTADARKWGIKEKVSTFTTYYPHTDYRNINIPRALSLIDGTVLAPGDTFSLNGTVGQRTKANGFVEGYVIDGGEITTALGGGVSQVATTTFNAAFFAGLKDIEHKPHSLYFDRYPVGREATVAWPTVDLKFQNDTPYGVLIETHVQKSTPSSPGVVTVSMWSTKYWDITTSTSKRYNVVKPGERVSTAPDCEPQEPNTGFDIKVYRHFNRDGHRVRTETMTTHYNAADKVTCKALDPEKSQG